MQSSNSPALISGFATLSALYNVITKKLLGSLGLMGLGGTSWSFGPGLHRLLGSADVWAARPGPKLIPTLFFFVLQQNAPRGTSSGHSLSWRSTYLDISAGLYLDRQTSTVIFYVGLAIDLS